MEVNLIILDFGLVFNPNIVENQLVIVIVNQFFIFLESDNQQNFHQYFIMVVGIHIIINIFHGKIFHLYLQGRRENC